MRASPALVVFAALVLVLVVATALAVRPEAADLPELSVRSTEPAGGRALALWLEDLGYRVAEIEGERYTIEPDVDALFVLAPVTRFDDTAVATVADWVERGGRLVLASTGGPRPLLERFGLTVRFTGNLHRDAEPVQPVLLQPPVGRVHIDAWEALEGRDGLAPWLAAGDRVYLGSRPYGQGQVIVLTATYPLTNAGLAEGESAALALNLIGGVPPGARVAFDEYHHGFVRGNVRSLWQLLLEHYWGWAILYAVGLGYLYLWLRGRRFGPPLAPAPSARRSIGEYVASLAALYRRAGQRAYVADRLADQLKRELATGLGLSARLPDEAFARAVAERRATSPAALAETLARLRAGTRLREDDLLQLVREADALKTRLLRHTG